ncbi:uncharacterized protein VTP21DRAFT_11549 [Calcarisporiella thermophila]|uniref:uncharacterized protein n=1 Tax=Calcarisporiella thermophila TaxID=911321 RepID=UPI0037442E65
MAPGDLSLVSGNEMRTPEKVALAVPPRLHISPLARSFVLHAKYSEEARKEPLFTRPYEAVFIILKQSPPCHSDVLRAKLSSLSSSSMDSFISRESTVASFTPRICLSTPNHFRQTRYPTSVPVVTLPENYHRPLAFPYHNDSVFLPVAELPLPNQVIPPVQTSKLGHDEKRKFMRYQGSPPKHQEKPGRTNFFSLSYWPGHNSDTRKIKSTVFIL